MPKVLRLQKCQAIVRAVHQFRRFLVQLPALRAFELDALKVQCFSSKILDVYFEEDFMPFNFVEKSRRGAWDVYFGTNGEGIGDLDAYNA